MGIIENIVDRCHVDDDADVVLAMVISKLVDGQATFDAMTPSQQDSFKLAVERKHAANRALYHNVMTGRF